MYAHRKHLLILEQEVGEAPAHTRIFVDLLQRCTTNAPVFQRLIADFLRIPSLSLFLLCTRADDQHSRPPVPRHRLQASVGIISHFDSPALAISGSFAASRLDLSILLCYTYTADL